MVLCMFTNTSGTQSNLAISYYNKNVYSFYKNCSAAQKDVWCNLLFRLYTLMILQIEQYLSHCLNYPLLTNLDYCQIIPPLSICYHPHMQTLLLLETTQLLIQLQKIKHEQLLITRLSQFLVRKSDTEPLLGKINIHAASAINWIIKQEFLVSTQENKEARFGLWAQFRDLILLNSKIPYKTLLILQDSLFIFLQTFEDKFQQIANELFSDLPYNCKVLFFKTIFDNKCEAQIAGRIVFLRENIQQFIGNALIFISEAHSNIEIFQNIKYCQLEKDSLQSLARAIQFLTLSNKQYNQDWEDQTQKTSYKILGKLVMNEKLINIIQEVMILSYQIEGNTNKYKLIKTQTIQYICSQGLFQIDKHINQYKALAMQIQCLLLNQAFCRDSGKQSFSTYHMLSVFEKQVPDIINFLTTLNKPRSNRSLSFQQMLQKSQYNDVLIALLQLLCSGLRFSYLRQIYLQKMKQICFQIAYILLRTSSAQRTYFQQSPKDFIGISQNLIQKLNTDYIINFNNEEEFTPKNKAGKLLEQYVSNIDQASLYLLGVSMDSIQYIASNNKIQSPELKQCLDKYHFAPSIQLSFVIFSIFSVKLSQERKDIAYRLRDFITNNLDFLKTLSRIEFARMCLMLSYNFSYIFSQNDDKRFDVVNLIVNRLDEKLKKIEPECTQTYCILQFFCENIAYLGGMGQRLWLCLIDVSNYIDNSEVLGKVYEVVRKVEYHNLPEDIVRNLSKILFEKIIEATNYELKINGRQLHENKMKGAPKIYEYLKILKSIVTASLPTLNSQQNYLLSQRKQIAQAYLHFFSQIFPSLNRIEFDAEIIQIYAEYLKAISSTCKIPEICFQLVKFLKPLHMEILGYNRYLFKIYETLLEKGFDIYTSCQISQNELEQIAKYHNSLEAKQTTFDSAYCLPKNPLSWIIHNLQYTLSINNMKKQQLLFYSTCNLLQYIFIVYGKIMEKNIHEHFHKVLLAKYEKQQNGREMKQWNLASLINTLAIGETIYPHIYNRAYLIVMDHSITMFKGYRAKVFSYAISKIVDHLIQQNQISPQKFTLLLDHLKLGVRLAHFSRQLALALNDKEQKIKKGSPFYDELTSRAKHRQIEFFNKIDKFEQIKKMYTNCKGKVKYQTYEQIQRQIEKQISKRQLYDLLNTVVLDSKPRMIFTVKAGSR